jgi:acyl carrier protein
LLICKKMEKILEILQKLRPEEDFTSSNNFIEDGLLDSFDIINLVTDLDQTFLISIDGVDIIPDNFKNISAIIALLQKNGASL